MENNAKFSIIVPVYNTPKDDLIYCLESIKSQTYTNFEVLVIDDGSNEETKNVLASYSNIFKIIKHENNKGIVAGRMTGIKNSTGDYVFFVDSDDALSNDCLETFNDIYKEYDPDLIMIETPRFIHTIDEELIPKKLYFPEGIIPKDDVVKEVLSLHINGIADKIAKRELLDFTSSDVDTSIINGEDLQQSVYVILKSEKIYYLHKDVCFYRFNQEIREYYDVKRLHDINYMIPPYKMVFEMREDYKHLLPTYKHACVNNVIATGFLLLDIDEPYKNIKKYLDELRNLDITKLLVSINADIPITSKIVFSFLNNRLYFLFKITNIMFKILGSSVSNKLKNR